MSVVFVLFYLEKEVVSFGRLSRAVVVYRIVLEVLRRTGRWGIKRNIRAMGYFFIEDVLGLWGRY